ncbi:hypothetical protein J5571_03690 [Streptococcus suis]|uniref:Uncharacterized protein n=1 Tax=Streptococcus suis TaxID=1307 RepID=A0AAW9DGT0_STRSU|nr:hypothetical protein [Streptococcus suis]MBO4115643.1 hypothetical protein [Streptococcus suis]MDX5038251.1 hypothetical protein [Streptococcus suis]UUM60373.1 hypothetical protein NQZ90_02650 [Streptococcus suis]HEL2301299.1 hypothetical protein [Streptococcus suis]HEL2328418.1 hypothetical protein [Streptococcus suis]
MRVTIHYPKPIKQLSSQKLPLLVDGKIAGTVTQGKILSLPITQSSVTLSVRGDKKSSIQVKDGDRVQIVENSKYFTLYFLSLAILPIVFLFDLPTLVKTVLLILALAVTFIGHLLFPKYIISTEKSSDH